MNGRVYDYNIGRFLSVDPFIQSPGDSQSINPYSYLMNNPMAGTDPTGYCAAATGSHIKDCGDLKVEVKVDGKTVGSTVVKDVNLKNGADVSSAMSKGVAQIGQAMSDVGSQKQIAQSKPPSGNAENKVEPFKLSTTIDRAKADDIDKKGFDLTERMVDMTKKAIEKSGDETLINEMNNTEFVYDPNNKVFENNPDVAAFRLANENSTTIYVGRKLIDVSEPNLTFPYHGTTIRGGDTGLLFVGLHEFGHVVGRQYANIWAADKKERFANSFAKKHYPRRLSGTNVNRKDIKFAKGIDE
jgi:hypothetical protein